MNRLIFYIHQIISNVDIKWNETSTYNGLVGLFTIIMTAVHHEEWKTYLMIAGGIVSFLHIVFPNSLKIDAMDAALEKEKHGILDF